jgi:hypothetical protein
LAEGEAGEEKEGGGDGLAHDGVVLVCCFGLRHRGGRNGSRAGGNLWLACKVRMGLRLLIEEDGEEQTTAREIADPFGMTTQKAWARRLPARSLDSGPLGWSLRVWIEEICVWLDRSW